MSCNGCRVLRKGCSENCILRQSLTAFETAQAQANATVFVTKFFGRAGLLSFLSAIPEYQRPALFQSLLLEACGRTVNPVNGAVGLLWTGNWHLCQSAVATVLRCGTIKAMPELLSAVPTTDSDNTSEAVNCSFDDKATLRIQENDLQLGLARSGLKDEVRRSSCGDGRWTKKLRTTPSFEASENTTMESATDSASSQTKLLQLFLSSR